MEEIPMSGRAGAGRKRSRTATAPVCYPITPFLTTAARRGGGPPSISTDYRTTSHGPPALPRPLLAAGPRASRSSVLWILLALATVRPRRQPRRALLEVNIGYALS